jgi:hypothetical protein
MSTGLRGVFAIAVLGAALIVPSQAMAGEGCSNSSSDPTAAQYCSVSGVNNHGTGPSHAVKGDQASGGETTVPVATVEAAATTAVESSGSDSLPFTGLDVGILMVVAAALGGAGLLLRRLTATGYGKS